VLPKLWNKTFSRVEPSHENSAAINDKLDKYWAKMKDVNIRNKQREIEGSLYSFGKYNNRILL